MNFDFICKISLKFSKMGITFAYWLGWKSFFYEKSSTRKVTSKFNWGNPVKHFQNPQKPNKKKVTVLSRSRGKKNQKNSNLLVAHRLLGAPLVTEKNWFRFFFGKNVVKSGQTVVKLWSNNGQTNYSRNISVTK